MFHPTAFENIRIVIEGLVYDLEEQYNYEIVNREDSIDLATYARTFATTFVAADKPTVEVKLQLTMEMQQVVIERTTDEDLGGCLLTVMFAKQVQEAPHFAEVEQRIRAIWQYELLIDQFVSHYHPSNEKIWTVQCAFPRYIYERNMDDFEQLIDYVIRTLHDVF